MGRIKAEVFCAMRARYAIALYEALALRRNMDRCIETFPIDRFRELLAVKVDTQDRYRLSTVRNRSSRAGGERPFRHGGQDRGAPKHGRPPIHGVAMAWWKKSQSNPAAAIQERKRSKIGRMARLKGGSGNRNATHRPVIAKAGVKRRCWFLAIWSL
jgi:hypothetical protein